MAARFSIRSALVASQHCPGGRSYWRHPIYGGVLQLYVEGLRPGLPRFCRRTLCHSGYAAAGWCPATPGLVCRLQHHRVFYHALLPVSFPEPERLVVVASSRRVATATAHQYRYCRYRLFAVFAFGVGQWIILADQQSVCTAHQSHPGTRFAGPIFWAGTGRAQRLTPGGRAVVGSGGFIFCLSANACRVAVLFHYPADIRAGVVIGTFGHTLSAYFCLLWLGTYLTAGVALA